MLINDILVLTQIFMDIASKKARLDQRYFEQFIEPAWKAFEKVHADYKESFKRYNQLISEENAQVQPIIEQIRQDSLYSSDLRDQLRKLVKYIPSAKLKTKGEYLLNFVKAINVYFGTPDEVGTNYYHLLSLLNQPNIPRWQAIDALSSQEAITEVGKIFDAIMGELQHKYERVADAYYRLRKELLT